MPVATTASGFMVDQDAKGLSTLITAHGSELILAGNNNGKMKIHNTNIIGKYFSPKMEDAYAIVKLKNGASYRHEFYYGSTYLSNSSRKFMLPAELSELAVYNFMGEKKIVNP